MSYTLWHVILKSQDWEWAWDKLGGTCRESYNKCTHTYLGATPVDHTTIPHGRTVPSLSVTWVGVTSVTEDLIISIELRLCMSRSVYDLRRSSKEERISRASIRDTLTRSCSSGKSLFRSYVYINSNNWISKFHCTTIHCSSGNNSVHVRLIIFS